MALTTYVELQTAIISWSHRNDLATVVPDFITLCETDFNRRLRIATMETRLTGQTFNDMYEDLPAGFIEMRQVKVTSSPERVLTYLTPEQMNDLYGTDSPGTPYHYTIIGTQIKFEKTPSSVTGEYYYYARIPALTTIATTNWMLTNNPDVYLFGSLVAMEPYLKNDKRFATWKNQYEAAIGQVADADKRQRWSGSALTMQVDTGRP